MDYKVSKELKGQAKFDITLEKQEWQDYIEKAYNKYKGRYNIEGFRKGKAPRKVIEKMYGENVFFEDALSDNFYEVYFEILKKEPTIQPIDDPKLTIVEISTEGVKLQATVLVKPEIKLNKYTGFGIKVEPKAVTAKEVDAEIAKALEQGVRQVEKDTEAKLGDIVNINFEGYVDGKKFDGGTSKNYDLELGSHSFIDTFEDQLVGVKKGDEKDVEVSFPKEYHAKDLSGKPAVFKIVVNSVKEKQLPELNDEFVQNTTEFDTVQEYKKDVQKKLEAQAKDDAKVATENQIIEKILENLEVEVPEIMVEQEIEHDMHHMEQSLMYQGLTLDMYAKYLNTTLDKIKEERKPEAVKAVKVRLAIQHIIEKENLKITDKDIEAKISALAKENNAPLEEFKKQLDDHYMSHIQNDVVMEKLLAFLTKNN